MKFPALILFLFIGYNLISQNLVSNCDFKEITSCPTGSGQLVNAKNWYAPGTGTSDLCHSCGESGVGMPHNMWGSQYAFSGESYAHIICYYPYYGNDYREYIQTELACELMPGKDYQVTFFMSVSDNSRYTVDGLGLHFSVEPLVQSGNNIINLDVPVDISFPPGTLVYDKEGWTAISGIYRASGGEKFITIGNFTPEEELTIYTFPGITTTYFSVYIDMVSVEPVEPWFNLGNDTVLCYGESFFIDATLDCTTKYQWEDGATDPVRLITSPGTYSLWAMIGCGSVYDEIKVDWFPLPDLLLPEDTVLCDGTIITLEAGQGFEDCTWQDGSKESYFIAEKEGVYWVDVIDANGCNYRDSVVVEEIGEPEVFLGQDTLICYNDTLVLIAGPEGDYMEYTWSDGSSGKRYEVDQEGEYWVLASNPCGTSYDTIYIGYHNCEAVIFIPNAFTPNNDGLNDYFRASGDNITRFRMQIYDRWGKVIFESFNIDDGWDGRVDGRDCPGDVYIWSVYYESDSGEKRVHDSLFGSFVLIR